MLCIGVFSMISVPCGHGWYSLRYDICSADDIRFSYEGNGYHIIFAWQIYHTACRISCRASDISLHPCKISEIPGRFGRGSFVMNGWKSTKSASCTAGEWMSLCGGLCWKNILEKISYMTWKVSNIDFSMVAMTVKMYTKRSCALWGIVQSA